MDVKLAYEDIDENAKFREQYRFVFAAAIVATYFIIPDTNILWKYLGYTVGLSALFAALYLTMSAAQLKYREPGRMYVVFKVSESLRMRAYDWSIHVFAIAVLFLVSMFLTVQIFSLFGASAEGWLFWIVLVITMMCIGIGLTLVEHIAISRKSRKNKPLPRV